MTDIGDYVIAALVTLLALLGIFLAAFADDNGIYIFGLGLAAFGVLFDYWLLKRHYDQVDGAHG